ncbi:MAG TPA: hypothetical protein V6D17_07980 [Candidatus Obscuribacterales bacterium]
MSSKPEQFSFEDKRVFSRQLWKTILRVFFAIIIIMLNITSVMSDIERHGKNLGLSWQQEVCMYLFLLFIDITILVPILMEVQRVEVTPEKLTLRTLFFQRAVDWKDITLFKQWRFIVYALLRTPRCFYLINRRDIKGFAELAQIIDSRLPPDKTQS